MSYSALLSTYLGSVANFAALPTAATIAATVPPGWVALCRANDTGLMYSIANGDSAWVAVGGGSTTALSTSLSQVSSSLSSTNSTNVTQSTSLSQISSSLSGAISSTTSLSTAVSTVISGSISTTLSTAASATASLSAAVGGSGFPNRTFTNTLTNSSTTTVIPVDNTIPQVTEGAEALTLSITPTSSSRKIRVEALIKGQASSGSQFMVAALFINGGANAVEADSVWLQTGTGGADINLVYEYVPGVTSAETIAVRFGPGFAGPTITLNQSGSLTLGGVMKSSLVAYEVA